MRGLRPFRLPKRPERNEGPAAHACRGSKPMGSSVLALHFSLCPREPRRQGPGRNQPVAGWGSGRCAGGKGGDDTCSTGHVHESPGVPPECQLSSAGMERVAAHPRAPPTHPESLAPGKVNLTVFLAPAVPGSCLAGRTPMVQGGRPKRQRWRRTGREEWVWRVRLQAREANGPPGLALLRRAALTCLRLEPGLLILRVRVGFRSVAAGSMPLSP